MPDEPAQPGPAHADGRPAWLTDDVLTAVAAIAEEIGRAHV